MTGLNSETSRPRGGGFAPMPASPERALHEYRARHQPRFRIGDGRGLFLRFDGRATTGVKALAWFGSAAQAEAAMTLFDAAKLLRVLPIVRLPDVAVRFNG